MLFGTSFIWSSTTIARYPGTLQPVDPGRHRERTRDRADAVMPPLDEVGRGFASAGMNGTLPPFDFEAKGLDAKKKTILYAPTFYPSSIENFPRDWPARLLIAVGGGSYDQPVSLIQVVDLFAGCGGLSLGLERTDLVTPAAGESPQHALAALMHVYHRFSRFRILADMQKRNMIVPVVGDFGGPKAIRAVGKYLKDNRATVTAFYTSNVEQYLFDQGDSWRASGAKQQDGMTP